MTYCTCKTQMVVKDSLFCGKCEGLRVNVKDTRTVKGRFLDFPKEVKLRIEELQKGITN